MLFIIAGGTTMCWVSFDMLKTAFPDGHPQLPNLILGGFLGLMGLLSVVVAILLLAYLQSYLFIYHDRIVAGSLFGLKKNTFYLHDMTDWKESTNSKSQPVELTLFFGEVQLQIREFYFTRFREAREHIAHLTHPTILKEATINVPEHIPHKKESHSGLTWFYLLLSLLFFWGAYHFINDRPAVKDELITIADVIVNEAEISRDSRSNASIEIELRSFPGFWFSLMGSALTATNSNAFIHTVKPGDSLWLDIRSEEYRTKLTKEQQAKFMDAAVNYHLIGIKGLRDKENTYLTLESLNYANKSSNEIGFSIFMLVGTIMIVLTIREYNKRAEV